MLHRPARQPRNGCGRYPGRSGSPGYSATSMLGGFWRHAASVRGEAWVALRRETLVCAVAALRARQARLPRFAAAEDAARLAEVMSFALAACVVAERFAAVAGRAAAPGWRPLTDDVPESAEPAGAPPPRPFGALLLARLAGEAGLGWLGQEPAALRALAAYFGDGPSELRAIAEEAERRIGLPLDRGPTVSTSPPAPAEEAAADRPEAPQPQAATAPKRTSPPAIGSEGAGWEWINWVRAGLRDGSVPINGAGAWLHNIAGEMYVVSAACFEEFAVGRELAAATDRNRVVRLGRHRQRVSRRGAANLFRAVLADGSRVKGMVFPGELIWDDDPPHRASAGLVGKGRWPDPPWRAFATWPRSSCRTVAEACRDGSAFEASGLPEGRARVRGGSAVIALPSTRRTGVRPAGRPR